LSLSLIKHYTIKTYLGSGRTAPCILNLGIRWRWVVSFMLQPLHQQAKIPVPTEQRVGCGPEPVWTWWWREQKSNPGHSACSLVPIVTELPWLTIHSYAWQIVPLLLTFCNSFQLTELNKIKFTYGEKSIFSMSPNLIMHHFSLMEDWQHIISNSCVALSNKESSIFITTI